MKNFLIGFMLLAMGMQAYSQTPKGFNYQAVARTGNGEILADQSLKVRIAILQGSTLLWQEDHAVETNQQGLFSLIIGANDDLKSGGSASSFSTINWGDGTYSMDISVDAGSGYTKLGNAPFASVPYALYAASGGGGNPGNWAQNEDTLYTNGSVGIGTSFPNKSLLSIQSKDPQVEQPLFEVKNDLGNPVFAVYNDGVMVYVDEDKKGVKGGFAVGGYNSAKKGVSQEYLRITPDSVRIWVPDENLQKGVKGGFAVGGYNSAGKSPSNNYLEITREKTNIFFDTTSLAKGFKGGFAVGGYNTAKSGSPDQLMSLTSSNYLIGQKAGQNITTGRNNTFFGWQAGLRTTDGSDNIFIGKFSGFSNSSGYGNIFLGNNAGANTTFGSRNVMLGDSAGYSNTNGFNNIFLGKESGYSNDNGDYNIFMGYRSGASHYTGISNIYIGDEAGSEADTSSNQVFIGDWAGAFATTGDHNIFIGGQAGRDADVTNYNSIIGSYSGAYAKGYGNSFFGSYAGLNANGDDNVLIGISAGVGTEGYSFSGNTYVGSYSGFNNTDGSNNVFLGYSAGYNNGSGTGNVFIGNNAGYYETGSNLLYIDNTDTSDPLILGDFFTDALKFNGNIGINYEGTEGYGLIVDIPANQDEWFTIWSFGSVYAGGEFYSPLGSVYTYNFKSGSNNANSSLSKIMQLNTGIYEADVKSETTSPRKGVVAEDMQNIFPQLTKKNMEGEPVVNYTGMIPELIEAIQEQQSLIEQQQAEIDALRELVESLAK